MNIDWTAALIGTAWTIILGGAGGLLTDIGDWYRNLEKPSWQPPDWAFGPAWTIILGLAGWSFYLAWTAAPAQADRIIIGTLFAVNFFAHLAWSPLFFKIQRPDWALKEVVVLWLSVFALIIGLAPYSDLAAWLNVPYISWVTFAALLNRKIVQLNAPFGKTAQQAS